MYKFTAKVTNGKFPETEAKMIGHRIKEFDGKFLTIELREFHPTRSNRQNAYWFKMLDKYVVPEFRREGNNWSSYKIHQWIMQSLGFEDAYVLPNGKIVALRQESHEFKTHQWEDFMSRARAHLATELNIFVPLPNEDLFGGSYDAQ